MRLLYILCSLIIWNSCSNKSSTEIKDFEYISGPNIVSDLLFEIGSSNEIIFGSISDIKILSDGNIAVLDDESNSFHILNRYGEHLSSKTFEGRGPGEVQNLMRRFNISEDDIISIYDYLSVKFVTFKYLTGKLNHLKDYQLDSNISLSEFIFKSNDQLILLRSSPRGHEDSFETVSLLMLNDSITHKSIMEIPKHHNLNIIESQSGLNIKMNFSSKYHTKNNICAYGNTIYYNRTDSIGFSTYNLESGIRTDNYNMDVPAILLTREEKENEVDSFIGDANDFFKSIDRDNLISDMPKIKPLVNKVICDLPDGIWMALLNENNESTWALFSDSGSITGILDHQSNENIISIHKGHIFTTETDDFGDITLRAYRYTIDDN